MTLCQLGIVVGILAAVLVNMLIQRMGDATWNTTVGWRWMFFAGIVPALLFVLTIVPVVESPRWLMKIGRRDQALHVLARINGADVATREALEIENSLAIEKGQVSELLPAFRRPLLPVHCARGIAADQRNHAGVLLSAGDLSLGRYGRWPRLLPVSPGQPDQPLVHSLSPLARGSPEGRHSFSPARPCGAFRLPWSAGSITFTGVVWQSWFLL